MEGFELIEDTYVRERGDGTATSWLRPSRQRCTIGVAPDVPPQPRLGDWRLPVARFWINACFRGRGARSVVAPCTVVQRLEGNRNVTKWPC